MFLKEYEGRDLFSKYGIRIPEGRLITKESASGKGFDDLCNEIAASLSGFDELVLKAQLLSGHRGQRGGVRFTDKDHLLPEIIRMFGEHYGDEPVDEILIEGKLKIERELFVSLTVDRFSALPVFLISEEGGVDIEELSLQKPLSVQKIFFDDVSVFPEEKIIEALRKLPILSDSGRKNNFMEICRKLFTLFSSEDAILAEINPLVLTKQDELIAADAKISMDDNALKRHPSYLDRYLSHLTPLEREAHGYDLSYVELDGDIAVIGNGAGLVMATLDTVSFYGGSPANFCDIGGGASKEIMEKALDLVLKKKKLRGIFVNVFGGITHCDEIARGIVEHVLIRKIELPMVIRMVGTNSDIANTVLSQAGIHVYLSFDDACKKAAQLSKKNADSRQ